MTGDRPQPEPVEELPMTEPGLVEPIAVGPGEPPASTGRAGGVVSQPPAVADPTDRFSAEATAAPAPSPDAVDRGTDLADASLDPADASLLALVDRLTTLLERSDLGELEVAAGETTIILRSPAALERPAAMPHAPSLESGPAADGGGSSMPAAHTALEAAPAPEAPAPARPSVKAPLTGIFYGAPSPGATAYVAVGDHVAVGQIIGLIEAMKLFNEIKSDLAGRVARVCADNGALVKAKQPLIEVDPA